MCNTASKINKSELFFQEKQLIEFIATEKIKPSRENLSFRKLVFTVHWIASQELKTSLNYNVVILKNVWGDTTKMK